jgi:cytochrome c oxidase cbb3-type subunit 2
MYDRPFQWSSKRTGPDLARVGGKYSDEWHTAHLIEPTSVVPESIMPSYSFLMREGADLDKMGKHLKTLAILGDPYTEEMIEMAAKDAKAQALGEMRADISGLQERYGEDVNARDFDGQPEFISEMDALVAYLQVLGTMVDFQATAELEKEMNEAEAAGEDIQDFRYDNPPVDKTDEAEVIEEK